MFDALVPAVFVAPLLCVSIPVTAAACAPGVAAEACPTPQTLRSLPWKFIVPFLTAFPFADKFLMSKLAPLSKLIWLPLAPIITEVVDAVVAFSVPPVLSL